MINIRCVSFKYTLEIFDAVMQRERQIKPPTKPSLLFFEIFEIFEKQKLKFEIIIVYLNNELMIDVIIKVL